MARKCKTNRSIVHSFSMGKDLSSKLKAVAVAMETSLSEVTRLALQDFIEAYESVQKFEKKEITE